MTTDEVVQAVIANRQRRAAEDAAKNGSKSRKKGSNSSAAETNGQSDVDWMRNAQEVTAFINAATKQLKLNHKTIIDALSHISVDAIGGIEAFEGSKADAWAACVAYHCDYNPDKVAEYIPDADNDVRKLALGIIQEYEIPF
jgi:hypothetical protein